MMENLRLEKESKNQRMFEPLFTSKPCNRKWNTDENDFCLHSSRDKEPIWSENGESMKEDKTCHRERSADDKSAGTVL